MPDIGYYTLPVLASFRGITGQVQSDLDKAFKGAGASAGKIMVQSATETLTKDPALNKAIQTAPAAMDAITKATDKQTVSVTKLRTEEKKLQDVRGTGDKQVAETGRIVVAEQKVTEQRTKQVDQIKQATTAHTELAQAVKKVNDEQQRTKDITTGSGSGKSLADQIKGDLGKALGGDASGAGSDLGNQLGKAIGAKIGGTLRDTVQDVTGMSVDTIADKVKSAGTAIGVDVGGAVTKAISGDKSGAFRDVGSEIGAKIGSTIRGQVKSLTGIDLGNEPGSLIQQFAPGAAGAVADWAGSGGVGDAMDWLKGGGLRGALGALKPGGVRDALRGGVGGVRGALGNIDPGSALNTINDISGGGAQPILDMHGGITDLAEGLLGGTAAERFLPAIADAALPVAAGTYLGQKLGRGLQGLDRGRVEAGYDDTGTATNPLERAVEGIPVVGDFLGPTQEIRTANQRRRDATPGSTESMYTSIFGDDRSGIGAGDTSAKEVKVQAEDATVMAASVTLAGGVSLPASMTGGISAGAGGGRAPSSLGSAGSNAGSDSLYGGDTGGDYFAMGGGPKGSDIVPAWLTPGEIVFDKDTSNSMRRLFGSGARYYDTGTGPGGAGLDVAAAAGMAGTPYSQGTRTDCSGMVGRVILRAMGMPETGLPTTKNMGQWLSQLGFKPGVGGKGMISVGWYDHGGGPNDGHAAITLSDGQNAEAGGANSKFTIGGGAAGAANPEFDHQMFLPTLFGQGASTGMPGTPGAGGGAPPGGGILGSGSGAGGAGDVLGQLLGGGGGGSLSDIGHQFMQDTLGLGSLFPDPTSDPLVQSGMAMMQAMLGMASQPGGLKGALTSDAAGKRTFGAMFGGDDAGGGGGFGMIPQVAGMPHPDDMEASPSDAAFGDVMSNRIGGGETHVDNSTSLTVNGFSAQEVGNQVYRNLGQSGVPNNTPRMNTNMPVGG